MVSFLEFFQPKILCALLLLAARVVCPAHFILLDLSTMEYTIRTNILRKVVLPPRISTYVLLPRATCMKFHVLFVSRCTAESYCSLLELVYLLIIKKRFQLMGCYLTFSLQRIMLAPLTRAGNATPSTRQHL